MSSTVQAAVAKIVTAIVQPVLSVLFALTVLLFIWGVAGLILNKDDAEKRSTSQQHILWGVIGMFIMVGSYGIIRLIAGLIGVPAPF